MVPYKLCRNQALNIVSTLLLSTAGDDDMATLLGLMHTAKLEDLELKNSVLKVIHSISAIADVLILRSIQLANIQCPQE